MAASPTTRIWFAVMARRTGHDNGDDRIADAGEFGLDITRKRTGDPAPLRGDPRPAVAVILPSGRTGTEDDSSGLRQTWMLTLSRAGSCL